MRGTARSRRNVRLMQMAGLAGLAGVAATGAVVARAQRRRSTVDADEVRLRLHRRLADAELAAADPSDEQVQERREDAAARDAAPDGPRRSWRAVRARARGRLSRLRGMRPRRRGR